MEEIFADEFVEQATHRKGEASPLLEETYIPLGHIVADLCMYEAVICPFCPKPC
jgi:hypothetical protein